MTNRFGSLSTLSFMTCSAVLVAAQTTTKAPAHHTTAAHRTAASTAKTSAPACAKIPVLSPKIPAVGTGTPCAKTLYTISSSVSGLSPQLSPALRENLEKLDQSFSLSYIDTQLGTGELAQPKKYYTVNYTGYLTDGTKFDSSLDRKEPITFPYGAHNVIQGWDTGFEGMRMGGKRRLFVPYQLAYGERGRPPVIPPQSELIFDVELISQSDTPPAPKAPAAPPTAPEKPAQPTTPASGSEAKPSTPPTDAKPASPAPATPPATTMPKP